MPVENYLLACNLVKEVMIFGNGQEISSALLIPATSDTTESHLQPIIDELNTMIPHQSRLRPGLWKLLRTTDEFVMTAKRTAIRQKTQERWMHIIEGMYESVTGQGADSVSQKRL